MWSNQRSLNWHLCSHISDHGKNSIFPSAALPWRSWLLRVFIHRKKELPYFFNDQYHWSFFKWVRVTHLLKRQIKVFLSLQRVNPPNMQLILSRDQLLLQSLSNPKQDFCTFLSLSLPVLSWDHLVLIQIGWLPWLRDCMSAFLDLLTSYTRPTTMFKFVSPPLRHSWIRFSAS